MTRQYMPWPDLLADLNMPQQHPVAMIASGQNNDAYELGEFIVRAPRHPRAERDLEREAAALRVVRPFLSTPVPEVELRNAGEHLVSVHAKLHGEPLSDLSGLKEKEQQLLAVDLATFLTELHSIPTAHWALGPVAQDGSEWRELLAQCEAQVFPLIPAERATELRQQFGEFLAIWEFLPCRIIHGDFGTGNILIDQDRLTGVIDFSGCGPGDPAYDFASLAAGFGDAFTDLVLNHFPEQEGMRTRIEFYRSTFPLLDILHGIENDDKEALRAGLMGVAGQWDE